MIMNNKRKEMRDVLKHSRTGNITNDISKRQEKNLFSANQRVLKRLRVLYPHLRFSHEKSISLIEMFELLYRSDKEKAVKMIQPMHESQRILPDGGIIYLLRNNDDKLPVLISEKKHQGGFDENVKVNGAGNAIERVFKNVGSCKNYCQLLGVKTIFPYVVFGDGNSFKRTASTMAQISMCLCQPFNQNNSLFGEPSFYFRQPEWNGWEMEEICFEIAERTVIEYLHAD